MIIINAENNILGRIATFAAKKALLGEDIRIVNSEKAIISGSKSDVLKKYRANRNRGIPLNGPYYKRSPEQIVKRTIRGMLPYKKGKGRTAFKKILCYRGIPEEFTNKEFAQIPSADYHKLTQTQTTKVEEISKELGANL
ncbi:MAG: 50S ribosomal protein L13 [Nanobdellota archaeon]